MTGEDIHELVQRFWSGNAGDSDRQRLAHCLKTHQRELKNYLNSTFGQDEGTIILQQITDIQADRWLQQIHAKAGIEPHRTKQPHSPTRLIWLSTAATLLIGLGSLLLIKRNSTVSLTPSGKLVLYAAPPVVHRNEGTEYREINLPDSSLAVLAPRAELTYDARYGEQSRSLVLVGEALFRVAKKADKPFTVHANGFATTALGTEFSVNTREAGITSIRLLSGKVVIRSTSASQFSLADTYLNPGEELRIDALLERLAIHKFQVGPSISTPAQQDAPVMRDVLSFDRSPLNEVFAQIATVKGVTINIDHARLEGLSFSGDLLTTDSLTTILALVCTMNDLHYRQEKNGIVINNK